MRHLQLSGGWKQWRRDVQWREAVRRCARMVHQELGKAMRSWAEVVENRGAALGVVRGTMGRWSHLKVARAFTVWNDFAELLAAESAC